MHPYVHVNKRRLPLIYMCDEREPVKLEGVEVNKVDEFKY